MEGLRADVTVPISLNSISNDTETRAFILKDLSYTTCEFKRMSQDTTETAIELSWKYTVHSSASRDTITLYLPWQSVPLPE